MSEDLKKAQEFLENAVIERFRADGLIHLWNDRAVHFDISENAFALAAAGILEMKKIGDIEIKDYWQRFSDRYIDTENLALGEFYGDMIAVIAAHTLHESDKGLFKARIDKHFRYGLVTGAQGKENLFECYYPADNALTVLASPDKILAKQISENMFKYLLGEKGLLTPNGVPYDDRSGIDLDCVIGDNALSVVAMASVGHTENANQVFTRLQKYCNGSYPNCYYSRTLIYMAALSLGNKEAIKRYSEAAELAADSVKAGPYSLYAICLAGRTLAHRVERK